jgi:DNA-binding NtrC family response regulator
MTMLACHEGAENAPATRQRDRRRGIGELLEILARSLDRTDDVAQLRVAFESTLAQNVRVRSLHLRDVHSRCVARDGGPDGNESIALEVPGSLRGSAGILEATFDPGCRLGEWDFQVLGFGAHAAALILEIERCRMQLARSSGALIPRTRREAATPIIGSTPVVQALRSVLERVAATDFTVLLEGESGVGKELVARQVHELSRRRNGPFVAVNCAALVETLLEAELFGIEERTATGVRGRRGKFEHADGGTLFLDEVSDLSCTAQAKLLRAIQDLSVERVGGQGAHRVDVRIVAATNRNLADLVERHLFRADLFYRLSGIDLRVPTLRERRADIVALANHFLRRHRPVRPPRLSEAAADALVSYDWPGNVRELERLIERVVALTDSDVIALEDLPPMVRSEYEGALGPSLERNDTMRAWGSRYARLILERCRGNKRAACRVLNLSYHTLQAYLRYSVHGIAVPPVVWEDLPAGDVAAEDEPVSQLVARNG